MTNIEFPSRRTAIALAMAAFALAAAALLAFPKSEARTTGALASADAPVVVELFTSQGCSSCPPADALAARLAREPGVLVISRPVTYWDRLGWKDTLARPANTELQRAYAQHGFDASGVYTPQMVIDGRKGAIGSQERSVRALIAQAGQSAKPQIKTTANGDVEVAGDKGGGEVVLVALRPSVVVGIGSGENGGRRVTYTNVVSGERVIGAWSGGTARFPIPSAARSDKGAAYAVLLRKSAGEPILAARMLAP